MGGGGVGGTGGKEGGKWGEDETSLFKHPYSNILNTLTGFYMQQNSSEYMPTIALHVRS